jgi:hypothetical protein
MIDFDRQGDMGGVAFDGQAAAGRVRRAVLRAQFHQIEQRRSRGGAAIGDLCEPVCDLKHFNQFHFRCHCAVLTLGFAGRMPVEIGANFPRKKLGWR